MKLLAWNDFMKWWFIGMLCVGLVSCGRFQRKPPRQPTATLDAAAQPRGWALMYPELMQSGGEAASAAVEDPSGGMGTPAAEGGMFDFSTLFQRGGVTSPGGLPWEVSAQTAIEKARTTGWPLLIFVTHQMSKPARELENTLLSSPAFRELAQDRLVLLRLDYSNSDTSGSEYYRAFKQRLKVRGYPALVMTLPDGEELLKLTSYKASYQQSYLKMLGHGFEVRDKAVAQRRETLKQEGYRFWKGREGTEVFARLTGLDANLGTFVGEWGITFKTFVNRLSEEDRNWILQRQASAAR